MPCRPPGIAPAGKFSPLSRMSTPSNLPGLLASDAGVLRQTRGFALAGLVLGGLAFCITLLIIVAVVIAATKSASSKEGKGTTQDFSFRNIGGLARAQIEQNTVYSPVNYSDPVLNGQRAVFLNGTVNNLTAHNVISQLLYLNARNPRLPINLYITSYGGDSDSAFALLDTMRMIAAPVNVWSLGGCESSGAMILVGATGKRYATPSSVIMIHANSEQSKAGDDKGYDDYDLDRVHLLWHSRSHIPAKWFPLTGNKEYYMTPKEALGYGVIDAVKFGTGAAYASKP